MRPKNILLDNGRLHLAAPDEHSLFQLYHQDSLEPITLSSPGFEIDGQWVSSFRYTAMVNQRKITSGGEEVILRYTAHQPSDLVLEVTLRYFPNSAILRFRYCLSATQPLTLTKSGGRDQITYFSLESSEEALDRLTEVQLSHFDPVAHSYMPNWESRRSGDVPDGDELVGPVVFLSNPRRTVMVAYEHGCDHPSSFLCYQVKKTDHGTSLELRARKGNYFHGQIISRESPWESVWFEVGLQSGDLEAFLSVYRRFFLEEVCLNLRSRQPYIFYNTWNYQERQRYFKRRPYLESMNAGRMLQEIEVAYRMGIDVFVIDTGWYIKTGDWVVNGERFPDGMREIKRKLDEYGMKLGLWFNPTVAALTSEIFCTHPEYEMTHEGRPAWRAAVWETEESTAMCLASDYADYYIEVMVRLYQELGVVYFKWDGVGQYGCDSSLHHHGTSLNSTEERAECYAYQMGKQMIRIVESASARCPEIIVDFDITEGGRFVGLGFLSAGKYFLVNNGPYFHEFDLPRSVKIEPDTINVFFYPGAARPRICRQGIKYDKIIPSILFLTHYLPDGPALSQRNSLAAMVLGGNGIWGDLPALGEGDIAFWHEQLALYKRVARYVTQASPRQRGFPGSSPEIYEKITPEAAGGVVVFFTVTPGEIVHYTSPLAIDCLDQVVGADNWEIRADKRVKITVKLNRDDARVVFLIPGK